MKCNGATRWVYKRKRAVNDARFEISYCSQNNGHIIINNNAVALYGVHHVIGIMNNVEGVSAHDTTRVLLHAARRSG